MKVRLFYYDHPDRCDRIQRLGWRYAHSCNEGGVALLEESCTPGELRAVDPDERPLSLIELVVDGRPGTGVYRPKWLDAHARVVAVRQVVPEARGVA